MRILFTSQDVLLLTDRRYDSLFSQSVKNLFECQLAPMIGLGGDVVSTGITFDLQSDVGGNVANLDSVQRTEISANPVQFARRCPRISLPLEEGHSWDISNNTVLLAFKILPPDVLLPLYAFYYDFADAIILPPIGEVEQYSECSSD